MIINRAAVASLTRWAPRAPDDLNRHDGVVSGEITRLVGVYDADGSLLGELSYFLRARVRRAHCALCAITHGRVRERRAWRASRDRLPVPFAPQGSAVTERGLSPVAGWARLAPPTRCGRRLGGLHLVTTRCRSRRGARLG